MSFLNFSDEAKLPRNPINILRWQKECKELVSQIKTIAWPENKNSYCAYFKFTKLIQLGEWENNCKVLKTEIQNSKWPFNRSDAANLIKFQKLIIEANEFLDLLVSKPNLVEEYIDALENFKLMYKKYQTFEYRHPDITLSPHFELLYTAKEIYGLVKSAAREQASFDIEFVTNALLKAKILLENPFSVPAQENLFKLANTSAGAPSLERKIKGLLLGLVGAALVAASIMIALPLFSVASPIIPGFLAVTGFYTQVIASSIVGLTGLIVLSRGIGIFSEGVRHGLAKQFYSLALVAETEQKARFCYP